MRVAPESILILGLDLLPLCVTFLLSFWEIQYGILAGTLVSLLILLHSVARPKTQVGSEEGECGWESPAPTLLACYHRCS